MGNQANLNEKVISCICLAAVHAVSAEGTPFDSVASRASACYMDSRYWIEKLCNAKAFYCGFCSL